MFSTVQPTTQQKVRRAVEQHSKWQESESRRRPKCTSGTPSVVNNYSIVASKGELARNNYSNLETPALSIVAKRRSTSSLVNGRIGGREENSSGSVLGKLTQKQTSSISKEKGEQEASRLKTSRNTGQPIPKSASVPSNLKEGFPPRKKASGKLPEESLLKKSSAFFASLTHTHARTSDRSEKEHLESPSRSLKFLSPFGYSVKGSLAARNASLRSYLSISSVGDEEGLSLRRSPSVQTLPTSWKKKNVTVKKSVSFSSDTSFEEKRAPFGRTAIHEAKVYCKGVLQDRDGRVDTSETKVPPSWDTPSGGPTALLRAAREADDAVLKEIVTRARRRGSREMDVNVADSSGRTAVSYMAGNGAAAMLELALSFEGVDPNLPDNEGNTPLHFAAQAGQAEALNVLLQRCPDIEVDARNTLGFTPLMKAALQGRTKCAKILLFAGANPTLRDHGRGLRAEQWARFCGRYACAEVIERFARHRLLERTTSCRWGSEPELAVKVLQGKVMPVPTTPQPPSSSGLKSKIRKVFRTTSGPDRTFSLVSQLTSAALCASSPALPKPGEMPPVVKSLLRPLNVPQLRVTLVSPQDFLDKTSEKYGTNFSQEIENVIVKPPRTKKKSK